MKSSLIASTNDVTVLLVWHHHAVYGWLQ